MSPENDFASIADASRPNAGRIYDYLLGGNHNFEIDRQSAEQLLKILPEAQQWFRLIRWFLGEAVRRLLDEGFTHFLDFASGLPTVDHIHQLAPKETKVIYSDIDPVTVAYAKEIIKDNPNATYVECNAAEPEKLLNSDVIGKMFGKRRVILSLRENTDLVFSFFLRRLQPRSNRFTKLRKRRAGENNEFPWLRVHRGRRIIGGIYHYFHHVFRNGFLAEHPAAPARPEVINHNVRSALCIHVTHDTLCIPFLFLPD